MRWWVFAIFAYLMLALQVGLAPGLSMSTSFGDIQPRFVLLLAVFVGLAAPQPVVMAAWAALGVLLDLTSAWTLPGDAALILLGPYTLGYLAGGYVILQIRAMLFRRHPLTIGSMMIVCGVAVHLIVVLVFTLRAWYEPLAGWSAVEQLAARGLGLFYSAAIGVLLAWPLTRLTPLFGFQSGKPSARKR